MANGKGFMDLPAELRNRVYEMIVSDSDDKASTKTPGALFDRWNNISHHGFCGGALFQSPFTIIATNRQVHSEFYPILRSYIVEATELVAFHVADLAFQPVMDWFNSLSTKDLARFQKGGHGGRIRICLDFEAFAPVDKTALKQWLCFARNQKLKIVSVEVTMESPPDKSWICHGFQYPAWVRKYVDFVESSGPSLLEAFREVDMEIFGNDAMGQFNEAIADGIYCALEKPWILYHQADEKSWGGYPVEVGV